MSEPHDQRLSSPYVAAPFATPGHLYLLVAGILIGVLLGPAVLGRFLPETYSAWFVGAAREAAQLASEEAALEEQVKLLEGVGVTDTAREELLLRETRRLAPLKLHVQAAQDERARAVRGWLGAILATLVVLGVVEPLVAPEVGAGRRAVVPRMMAGLVTARYALLAIAVALVLARPGLLQDLPWLLVAGLTAVALFGAAAPLGRRTSP